MEVTVKEGHTLDDYMVTFGYTEGELRMANPGIKDNVIAGQRIELPTPESLNEMYAAQEEAIRIRPERSIKEDISYDRPPTVVPVSIESNTTGESTTMPLIVEEAPLLGKPISTTKGDWPGVGGKPTMNEEVLSQPSPEFLEHLRNREGVKQNVYLDSLGKPTAGVGHYDPSLKEGDIVSEEQVAEWLVEDSRKAWDAAVQQAKEVGRTDKEFVEGLASVNYQLGTEWNKEHKATWGLMKKGLWQAAALEAANSVWNQQTPVRVLDFQKALTRGLK
jgi:GH24 family phage-related lysozyme (muramidase)